MNDERRDEGEFYPDGRRWIPPAPAPAGGGDMSHAEFADLAELPERFNDGDVSNVLNGVVRALKGGAALALAFAALSAAGAGVTVHTAPKGEVYNDEAVVTNVTFDASGLATETALRGATNAVAEEISRRAAEAQRETAASTNALAAVAHTGSYADLSGKPAIPVVPTDISAFANNAGYVDETVTNALSRRVSSLSSTVNGKVSTNHVGDVKIVGRFAVGGFADGTSSIALGGQCNAEGDNSIALGTKVGTCEGVSGGAPYNPHKGAFAWQGHNGYSSQPYYYSHGPGTFNINPVGGLRGFWIGETNLADHLAGYATTNALADATSYALVSTVATNGAMTLLDRAVNTIAVTNALNSNQLRLALPAAASGRARDFFLRLEISSGVTAPEIQLPVAAVLESSDGTLPTPESGKTTIYYFSETKANTFLVKGETVQTVGGGS